MDNSIIFTKTAKGVREAAGKTSELSRAQRNFLKEVDGKRTCGELLVKFSKLTDVELHEALAELVELGFIREFVQAARSSASGTQDSAPVEDGGDLDFSSIGQSAPVKDDAEERRAREEKARQETDAKIKRAIAERAKQEAEAQARRATEEKAKREAEELAKRAERDKALHKAEAEARREAELKLHKELEEHARRAAAEKAALTAENANREAEEKARKAAAEAARKLAEEKARQDAEATARREAEEKIKREAADRARMEAEEQALRAAAEIAKRKADEQAHREAEEKARREAEEKARREAEEKARREAEEQARKEAEARARREAEENARREAEERARREAEELARREAEEKARKEAEEQARREAEEKARREAEEKVRRETEELAKREAEEKARREVEENARREAEEKARHEAEEKARKEAEEQARREAEEKARREAEEQARREAEERARREAEENVRREAEEKARREADELARREAEEKTRKEAEEQARREAEEKVRREAEEKMRREAEEKARREAEEQARREAEEKARREVEERVKRDAEEQLRREAAEQARREAEEKARLEAEEKARKEAEKQAKREAEEQAKLEAKALARQQAEEKARQKAEEKAAAKSEKMYGRRQVNWPKVMALGTFVLIALVVGLIHVIPFNGRIPKFEAAATEVLQQPVRIGGIHMSLFPRPHWLIEDVSIGAEGQVRIQQITAVLDSDALFSDRLSFGLMQFHSPAFGEEGLKWLLFGRAHAGQLRVAQVSVVNGKLDLPNIALPLFDAKAEFRPDGNWQKILIFPSDKSGIVELQPEGERIHIEINADNFVVPFGSAIALKNFTAKGSAGVGDLALGELDGQFLGGFVSGTANLKWAGSLSLEGQLSARQIDVAQLAPGLLESGKLDGKAAYSLRAQQGAGLFAAPHLEGSFVVQQGVLLGVDLMRLLKGSVSGDKTAFTELSGNFVYDANRLQLPKLRLGAGILSANGSADMDRNKNIHGRFFADFKSSLGSASSGVSVSGTVENPRFAR